MNSGGIEVFVDDYAAYVDTAKLCMGALGHDSILALIAKAETLHRSGEEGSEAYAALNEAYYDLELDLADSLIGLAIG